MALKHFVLHLESTPAQIADGVIFNLTAITGLVLGIREKRAINSGTLTFGDGLITGIKIAVTYPILTSAYFAILLTTIGAKLMRQEGETSLGEGIRRNFGFAFVGTVYSAIIALVLRNAETRDRRSRCALKADGTSALPAANRSLTLPAPGVSAPECELHNCPWLDWLMLRVPRNAGARIATIDSRVAIP